MLSNDIMAQKIKVSIKIYVHRYPYLLYLIVIFNRKMNIMHNSSKMMYDYWVTIIPRVKGELLHLKK